MTTKYTITDLAALKAAYPHFVTMKERKFISIVEEPVLDQRKVKLAIKAGITVPGIEEAR